MLTEAVLQTSTPTSFKINDVDQDELFILESISGLSSVKNNLLLGEFAREGGYYMGRRRGQLNPVFNFRLQPNFALDIEASDLREMLYRMFLEPQRNTDQVQVLLKDDRKPDRYFIGYTETFEAEIFAKEMKAQVGLLTTDHYLYSVEEISEVNGAGWFSRPITYVGSADTGFQMTVKVLAVTETVAIVNETDFIVLEGGFLPDDEIIINTLAGSRAVTVNGEDRMVAMTGVSQWIQLKEQSNNIAVFGSSPGDGAAALTAYSYRGAWWGV